MDRRPHVLITNDDGIDSYFLHALVKAHLNDFKVTVAAPKREQSWIGRALSRHRTVKVERYRKLGDIAAWSIDGTPSDCINIALGNLLPEKPDIVISGINVGYNTTVPLIYSSGTIAGALEGATWGLPAIAYSQQMEPMEFVRVASDSSDISQNLKETLRISSEHAANFTQRTFHDFHDENAEVDHNHPEKAPRLIVHNVNFPTKITETTVTRQTVPGGVSHGGFYQPVEAGVDEFVFRYQAGIDHANHELTDRRCLAEGAISHSILNFSNLKLS